MPRVQHQLRVSRKAARVLRAGHPWFFKEGGPQPPPGTLIELLDRDEVVAWGLADEGRIAVRVLGRRKAPKGPLADVIGDRVRRADGVRARLLDHRTDAYRVVSSAGDGLPDVIVDRYGSLAVLRLYASAWVPHLDDLVRAITTLGWVETVAWRKGVERVDGGKGLHVLHGPEPKELLVVHEGEMKLPVRPYVGQKTGLFLDQRDHRALIRGWSAGRIVANLFAYNGGFSVAAALGGAAHVTTVDIAPDAVDDAKLAFELNGVDPAEHSFEVADVFAWKPPGKIDLLIVDPPALSRDASSDDAATRAYRKLHTRLGPFVPRDGLLATSSCSARLSLHEWQRVVGESLARTGDWSWHHLSAEPADHPMAVSHSEAHYLKFALLRRR